MGVCVRTGCCVGQGANVSERKFESVCGRGENFSFVYTFPQYVRV